MKNWSLKGKRFLIVDDEPLLREVIRDDIECLGAEVVEAGNGREAYEQLLKSDFDVVLSDVRMPGGGGVELLERIRALHPSYPIVVLMSAHSDTNEAEALSKGAQAFFNKPCSNESVLSEITKMIGSAPKRSA